nr:hypothetical protein [Tanacetum cinerariifolium]
NGDQPLPIIAQVSLAGNARNAPPTFKDPKFWTTEEKKTRKIDRLARSLLIQGLPNDIYSLIDNNETAKDLWDALESQMRGSEYGEQDRKDRIVLNFTKINQKSNKINTRSEIRRKARSESSVFKRKSYIEAQFIKNPKSKDLYCLLIKVKSKSNAKVTSPWAKCVILPKIPQGTTSA